MRIKAGFDLLVEFIDCFSIFTFGGLPLQILRKLAFKEIYRKKSVGKKAKGLPTRAGFADYFKSEKLGTRQ